MRSLIGEQNTDTEMSSGSHANHLIMLRCNTILKGARLADKMSRLVKCILSCHLFDDRPISKFNAQNIFRLIEMIKAIVATINFYWPSIQGCSKKMMQLRYIPRDSFLFSQSSRSFFEQTRQHHHYLWEQGHHYQPENKIFRVESLERNYSDIVASLPRSNKNVWQGLGC